MGKWERRSVYGEIVELPDGGYIGRANNEIEASALCALHNVDIDALTARAEAAEAERDELRRQLEKILASLKPTEREDRGREHSSAACDVYYLKDRLYNRAKALIEPKDPSNIEPTKEGL